MESAFAGRGVELATFRFSRQDRQVAGFVESGSRKQKAADDLQALRDVIARISPQAVTSAVSPVAAASAPSPSVTTSPSSGGVSIVALQPNPDGKDDGNEYVILRNGTSAAIQLDGWKMRDKANHAVELNGEIAAGQELKIKLQAGEMPLNNSGDDVELLSPDGKVVQRVTYTGSQVKSGLEIRLK